MIIIKLTQISMKQNTVQQSQKRFDDYVKDQLKWLQDHYQQGNKGKNALDKIGPIKKMFDQLKNKLRNYNGGNYFRDFQKIQTEKLMRLQSFRKRDTKLIEEAKKIYEIDEQRQQKQYQMISYNSQDSKDSKAQQLLRQKIALQNHRTIIKFLTNKRYSFSNIARHIYRGSLKGVGQQLGSQGFGFDVEKGFSQWNKDHSIGLLYVFIRDMCKAIIQLQKYSIFHLDIKLRNVVLFIENSLKYKDLGPILNNPKELAKIINYLTFKLIDFGNALLLGEKFIQNTRIMIPYLKEQVLGSLMADKSGQVQLEQISKLGSKSNAYKAKHARSFLKYFYPMVKNITNPQEKQLLNQFKEGSQSSKAGKYYLMIEKGKYKELIDDMENCIKKFINYHQASKK